MPWARRSRAILERGRGVGGLATAGGRHRERDGVTRIVEAAGRLGEDRLGAARIVGGVQARATEREARDRPRRLLGRLRAREHVGEHVAIAEPAREHDRGGIRRRGRAAVLLEHLVPRGERRGGRALEGLGAGLFGARLALLCRRADRFFPRERGAELGDVLVELIAGMVGELGEQARAVRPATAGGERLAERLGDRQRVGTRRAPLGQQLDRGIEAALRDQRERGAQARAIAGGVGGDREVDVDRLRGLLGRDVRGAQLRGAVVVAGVELERERPQLRTAAGDQLGRTRRGVAALGGRARTGRPVRERGTGRGRIAGARGLFGGEPRDQRIHRHRGDRERGGGGRGLAAGPLLGAHRERGGGGRVGRLEPGARARPAPCRQPRHPLAQRHAGSRRAARRSPADRTRRLRRTTSRHPPVSLWCEASAARAACAGGPQLGVADRLRELLERDAELVGAAVEERELELREERAHIGPRDVEELADGDPREILLAAREQDVDAIVTERAALERACDRDLGVELAGRLGQIAGVARDPAQAAQRDRRAWIGEQRGVVVHARAIEIAVRFVQPAGLDAQRGGRRALVDGRELALVDLEHRRALGVELLRGHRVDLLGERDRLEVEHRLGERRVVGDVLGDRGRDARRARRRRLRLRRQHRRRDADERARRHHPGREPAADRRHRRRRLHARVEIDQGRRPQRLRRRQRRDRRLVVLVAELGQRVEDRPRQVRGRIGLEPRRHARRDRRDRLATGLGATASGRRVERGGRRRAARAAGA